MTFACHQSFIAGDYAHNLQQVRRTDRRSSVSQLSASYRQSVHGECFLNAAQASLKVQDRYQLFMWMNMHMHRFIPHEVLLCRLMSPSAELAKVFHSVPLSDPLVAKLQEPRSPLWERVVERWMQEGRRPVVVPLDGRLPGDEPAALRAAGFAALLVHGAADPPRTQAETMFVFALPDGARDNAGDGARDNARIGDEPGASKDGRADGELHQVMCDNLALWLPYMHFMAVRALSVGKESGGPPRVDKLPGASAAEPPLLTARELQVLMAVRDARRNIEIGQALGISALTVKNHLRKIMQKLGARNRAQAVAEAMSRQMIS